MTFRNIRGYIYLEGKLFCTPGADFMFARVAGVQQEDVEICIDADALSADDPLELILSHYSAVNIDGLFFDTPALAVTALNNILGADSPLSLPKRVAAGDIPTAAGSVASGQIYSNSGVLTIKP